MSKEGVCPLLRSKDHSYYCDQTKSVVNPFEWYCLLEYYMCPMYVSYARERAVAKPEEKRPEMAEEKAVVKEVSRELEDMVLMEVRSHIEACEGKLKDAEEKWRLYEDAVMSVKQMIERSSIIVEYYLNVLRKVISQYELNFRELEYRRSAGILDEEIYAKMREELERKVSSLREEERELSSRYESLLNGLSLHMRRILMLSASPAYGKLQYAIKKLEDMYKEGKISQGVYERVKKDLEKIIVSE